MLSGAFKFCSCEVTYLEYVLCVRVDRKLLDFFLSMFEVAVSTISPAEISAECGALIYLLDPGCCVLP